LSELKSSPIEPTYRLHVIQRDTLSQGANMTHELLARIRRARVLGWSCSRTSAITRMLLLAAGVVVSRAGHAQSIRITEPIEWRGGQALTLVPGRPIRIAGSVQDSAGVARVLINGRDASLKQDPVYSDFYEFERILSADSITKQVTIRVVAKDGRTFERQYLTEGAAVAQTTPTSAAPKDTATRRTVPVTAVGPATTAPPAMRPNVWGPFRLRGIGYGAAAAAGAVLFGMSKSETSEVCSQSSGGFDCVNRTEVSKPYQGAGFALLGGAAVALVIDAVLTTRKDKSTSVASATTVRDGPFVRLEAPSVSGSSQGMILQFLRFTLR
jgi:hypothetical protein